MDTVYGLVIFSKKTGKIFITLNSYSNALLKLYVLQNLKAKTKCAVIFNCDNGDIVSIWETDGYFPNESRNIFAKNVSELGITEEFLKDIRER